jgi:hypothetical protein
MEFAREPTEGVSNIPKDQASAETESLDLRDCEGYLPSVASSVDVAKRTEILIHMLQELERNGPSHHRWFSSIK